MNLLNGSSNLESKTKNRADFMQQLKSFKILRELPEVSYAQINIAIVRGSTGAIVVTKNDEVFAVSTEVTKFLGYNPGLETKNRIFRLNDLCNRGIIGKGVFGTGIAMGSLHFAAWTESGEVWVWGANESGQLGVGHAKPLEHPEVARDLKREKVVKVACGTSHTLCLTKGGKVYTMEIKSFYQAGRTTKNSSVLTTKILACEFYLLDLATDIACVSYSSYVVTKDGSVLAWGLGLNNSGQTGAGVAVDEPTEICTNWKVIKVVGGTKHCLVLTETKEVYVWGTENGIRRNLEKLPFEADLVEDVAANGSTNFCKEAGKVVVWGSGWEVSYITFEERKVTQFCSIEEAIASKDMSISESMRFLNDQRETQLDLLSVFNQPHLWDLEFKVEGKMLKASKHLLVVRCDYFAKMVSGEWKEQSNTDPLIIEHFSYGEFKAFLGFIHTDRLIVSSNCDALIGMLKLADYYGCPLLQAKVTEALGSEINRGNAFRIYSASLRFNAMGARLQALDYIAPKFVECAKVTEDSQLKNDCVMQLLIDLQGMKTFK